MTKGRRGVLLSYIVGCDAVFGYKVFYVFFEGGDVSNNEAPKEVRLYGIVAMDDAVAS